MANDTSGGAEVVVTEKPAKAEGLENYHKSGSHVTTNAQTLGEPSVWLGILQDWIQSARKAGLIVEPYDMRPTEQGAAVVLPGVFFCAECGNFTRGNACGNGCGNKRGNEICAERGA